MFILLDIHSLISLIVYTWSPQLSSILGHFSYVFTSIVISADNALGNLSYRVLIHLSIDVYSVISVIMNIPVQWKVSALSCTKKITYVSRQQTKCRAASVCLGFFYKFMVRVYLQLITALIHLPNQLILSKQLLIVWLFWYVFFFILILMENL